MKKNVIFVFTFAAVILGLLQLCACSPKETKSQLVNGIAQVSYPDDVEIRNDIPFELLVNQDDRKLLPDSVDLEKFRPHLILLQKGFDEKKPEQLKQFPSIVVKALTFDRFDASVLKAEDIALLSNKMRELIVQNAGRTSATVSDWNTFPVAKIKDATVLKFGYKLENKDKKILNITVSYLFKGNKQVEVTLSAPDKDLKKWTAIYDEVLNNTSIN